MECYRVFETQIPRVTSPNSLPTATMLYSRTGKVMIGMEMSDWHWRVYKSFAKVEFRVKSGSKGCLYLSEDTS
jgi:hypothetical protein